MVGNSVGEIRSDSHSRLYSWNRGSVPVDLSVVAEADSLVAHLLSLRQEAYLPHDRQEHASRPPHQPHTIASSCGLAKNLPHDTIHETFCGRKKRSCNNVALRNLSLRPRCWAHRSCPHSTVHGSPHERISREVLGANAAGPKASCHQHALLMIIGSIVHGAKSVDSPGQPRGRSEDEKRETMVDVDVKSVGYYSACCGAPNGWRAAGNGSSSQALFVGPSLKTTR